MNKQVTIRGIVYPSGAVAAQSLGVTKCAVYKAKREGRLETVGLGHTGGERLSAGGIRIANKPITIQGVPYPSRTIAAEVLGVSRQTIYRAERTGKLAHIGCDA